MMKSRIIRTILIEEYGIDHVMINFAESPENLALVGPDITNGIWMPFDCIKHV